MIKKDFEVPADVNECIRLLREDYKIPVNEEGLDDRNVDYWSMILALPEGKWQEAERLMEYIIISTDRLSPDTKQAFEDVKNGTNLLGPFHTMAEYWAALEADD